MDKAYDLKALGQKIVEKGGLTVAEDALESIGKQVYLGLKEWLAESAALSENKIDDVVAPLIAMLDPIVLPLIEKIDLDGDKK